jgi:hypothetical protein
VVETYYASVYWTGRKESAEQCARRAETYLRLLASIDATWVDWFLKGDSLRDALKHRIAPQSATFEALFALKKYRLLNDGYMLGLWSSGQVDDASTTHLTCGAASHFVTNACTLGPPNPTNGPVGERIVSSSCMTKALRAMALAWEPDRGVVMSHAHRDLLRVNGKLPPVLVGWVTYLSRRRGTVPPLPEPVRVEPVEELGSLITLTPERFTANNPSHVNLAAQVQGLLDQAGLLRPEQFTSPDEAGAP